MYYYHPRLSDGRLAPFAWQIRLSFFSFNWPLEKDTAWIKCILDKFLIITSLILMILGNVADLGFIMTNTHEIDVMMDAIAPYLVAFETPLRMYHMAFRKQKFRTFLQEFYAKIYLEKNFNDILYNQIKRSMLPTVLYSYSYLATLMGYFAIPIIGLFRNQRILPYKILIPYDYTPVNLYIPTLCFVFWLPMAHLAFIISESILLATIILHLNARYLLLQQDCQNLHVSLMSSCRSDRILFEFRQGLLRIIKRHVELNEFAAKFQDEYSFRVFMIFSVAPIMLCVLGYMIVTTGMSSKIIHYVLWIAAKVLELLVFGRLGSTLISTTDKMNYMYYMSNWEDVILQSSNTVENNELMKLIVVAIELNQKPIYVTGLHYFSISLTTVVTILQGAFSYFSCLYALR